MGVETPCGHPQIRGTLPTGGGLGKPYWNCDLVCVGVWVFHGALLAREKSLEGFPSSQERKMSCLAQSGPWRDPASLPPGAPLASAEARAQGPSPGLGLGGTRAWLLRQDGWEAGLRALGLFSVLGGADADAGWMFGDRG